MRALAVVGGADAHLDGTLRVDDAVAGRQVEHGAMVGAAAFIGLDVAVSVEMHQRQGAMFAGMRLQQRKTDEVIAAEADERGTGVDDPGRMVLDAPGDLFLAGAPIEIAVAVVDDGEVIERVEEPRPQRPPGKLRRCLADGLRPETRAGAIGSGLIERDAGDGDVDVRQLAGVPAAA